MNMELKKIDVPNKIYEYRDDLKKEHNIVGDFKRFDIVYVENNNKSYIGIIEDSFHDGYKVRYINENGAHWQDAFTSRANVKLTLVERQNPIKEKDDYDF